LISASPAKYSNLIKFKNVRTSYNAKHMLIPGSRIV